MRRCARRALYLRVFFLARHNKRQLYKKAADECDEEVLLFAN